MGKARSVDFCFFCDISVAGHFRRKATPSHEGKPTGVRGALTQGLARSLVPGPRGRSVQSWASVSLGTEASPRRRVERDVRGEELLVEGLPVRLGRCSIVAVGHARPPREPSDTKAIHSRAGHRKVPGPVSFVGIGSCPSKTAERRTPPEPGPVPFSICLQRCCSRRVREAAGCHRVAWFEIRHPESYTRPRRAWSKWCSSMAGPKMAVPLSQVCDI